MAHELSAVNYLVSYDGDKAISSDGCIYVAGFFKKQNGHLIQSV